MRACLDSLVSIALISAIGVVFVMDDSHGNPPPQPIPTTETPQPELPPPLPQFEPPVEFVNFEPPVPELPKIDPPKDFAPPIDRTPRLRIGFDDDFRAGIVTTSGNPDDPADDNKKLTYSEIGSTNNTRLFVDGLAPELGKSPGQVTRSNQKTARGEFESIYMFRGVRLTRQLTLIPGAVSRRMDVVRVTYLVENIDRQPHNVGLRVMLDTLIGNNDGVPFIVPGTDGIVTSPVVYRSGNIPDFVRALENPDLQNPGVIVDIGLRVDAGVESPNEVVLSFWPGSDAKWDYDRLKPFGKDTCIGMFYLKRDMQPGEKRVMSYTYGLGSISSTRTQNAAISLTAGGPFRAGGKFWLVALVQNPQAGQRVAISLPTGVTLGPNEQAEKPVPPSKTYSQISWLLSVADRAEGQALLKAKLLPDDTEETQTIDIEARKARLKLIADGPITSGGAFWLTGVVPNPLQGQEVEITLPQGLSLNPQDPARKPV
ncbi:MAG: hypothetical protein O3A00_16465, partial [Planctomycetota bacterium]|nr:hypothetical protein [Planctomycetota bacterium]